MGRFIKELRYSLGMKKHIFFIILICFVVCGTAWLFQDTLTADLEKAFPTKYAKDKVPTVAEQRHISGTVKMKTPTVTDADLKAELKFNEQLKKASWIKDYGEIATSYIQIKSYLGPDSAVKGYLTDAFNSNKDVDSGGAKYTNVNTIWMEESLAKQFHLGQEAVQIFKMPNDYLEKIYVVLGSAYRDEGGYQVGNIIEAKDSDKPLKLQVVGFLERGATAKVGEKEVVLDSYILCPFISLADVYEVKEEETGPYADGVFIQDALINENLKSLYRNSPPQKKNEIKSGVMYGEVKALYIDRAALDEADAPAWLKSLALVEKDQNYTRVAFGATYKNMEGMQAGATYDLLIGKTLSKMMPVEILQEGTTWEVYGIDVTLDDYIVFLQEPEEEETQTPEKQDGENPEDTEPEFQDEPYGTKEREFSAAEKLRLFTYQHMMNSGYFMTTLTSDEAQEQLWILVDKAWEDFERDNQGKDKEALSTYKIEGADPANSILYRENAPKLSKKIVKFTKYGFFFGMLLFALYLFWKFWRGRAYYSSLYLTGTNRTEMAVLYLIEGVLMAALAAALSVGFAFVISKLLQLHLTDYKPLVKRFIRLAGYPTAAIVIWILVRDFGRMFRRTEEM